MLLPEGKVDAGWAKIKRCLLLRGERFAWYWVPSTQFQFDSRHIHQFLPGFMMELGETAPSGLEMPSHDDDTDCHPFLCIHYLAGPFNPVSSPPS